MTATWLDRVTALPSVGLEALNADAALLTRVDRKYLVPPQVVEQVIAELTPELAALEIDGRRASAYRSVYYDTPGLVSFMSAARGRPQRFKVRRRDYLDTGESLVEVKLRSARGGTVKHRRELAPSSEVARMLAIEDFAASFPQVAPSAPLLQATLVTSYRRTTLLCASARITIDADVRATDEAGRQVDYGTALIVETKSVGAAGAVDRALWARGFRPQRLSKYATSMAALDPALPSHRWNRTIRRHAAAGLAA